MVAPKGSKDKPTDFTGEMRVFPGKWAAAHAVELLDLTLGHPDLAVERPADHEEPKNRPGQEADPRHA